MRCVVSSHLLLKITVILPLLCSFGKCKDDSRTCSNHYKTVHTCDEKFEGCTAENLSSHCIIGNDGIKKVLLVVCCPLEWIDSHYCPVFNISERQIEKQKCNAKDGNCHNFAFLSNDGSKFSGCIRVRNETTEVPMSTVGTTEGPSTPNESVRNETTEVHTSTVGTIEEPSTPNESRNKKDLLGLLGLLPIILLAAVLFWVVRRYLKNRRRRTQNPGHVETTQTVESPVPNDTTALNGRDVRSQPDEPDAPNNTTHFLEDKVLVNGEAEGDL